MEKEAFIVNLKEWIKGHTLSGYDENGLIADLIEIKELCVSDNVALNRCVYKVDIPFDANSPGTYSSLTYITTERLTLDEKNKDAVATEIIDYEIINNNISQ